MKKWEYFLLDFNQLQTGSLAHNLKELGESGWEPVAVTGKVFYFKRPKTKT